MSIVRLTEGERRSAVAWRNSLALDPTAWDQLVADGIFVPSRGNGDSLLRLEFVGVIALSEHFVVCIPRFGLPGVDPVAWVRRVLAAYFVRESRRPRLETINDLHYRDDTVFREYDALLTLLGIFAEQGVFRRAVSATSRRGGGAIDWSATLARSDPLVVGGFPIYTEPHRTDRQATTNEVSVLQAAVTVWLARKYDVHVPAALSDVASGIDLEALLSSSRSEFHLALLRRERAVTYLAADLRLLDTLEAVISGRRRMGGLPGARLHGTTAFEMVWEDALRDLVGDDGGDASLAVATWYIVQETSWSAPETAPNRRLDLLVRHGPEVMVLDAKYYHPFPKSRPGWADIIKQVYYAETIELAPGETVRNAFLLPLRGRRLALAGRVRIEGGPRALPDVEAWHVDPDWAFSSYADGSPGRRAIARDELLAARDEMLEMLGETEGHVGV